MLRLTSENQDPPPSPPKKRFHNSPVKENRIKNKEPKVSGHRNQSLKGGTKTQKDGRTHQVVVFAVLEETRAAVHRTKTEDLEPTGSTQKVNVASVIAELDAGAEDGASEIIELWIPPAAAAVLLARLKEKEKETHKHKHACGLWPHHHNLC